MRYGCFLYVVLVCAHALGYTEVPLSVCHNMFSNRPKWTNQNKEYLYALYFDPLYSALEHLELIFYDYMYQEALWHYHQEHSLV